jgi:hypothetical protein
LLDLTDSGDLFTDFEHINRVVITLGLGFSVDMVRIFPSLKRGCNVQKMSVNEVCPTISYSHVLT